MWLWAQCGVDIYFRQIFIKKSKHTKNDAKLLVSF